MQPQTMPLDISPRAQRPTGRMYQVMSLVRVTWTHATIRIILDIQALVDVRAFTRQRVNA